MKNFLTIAALSAAATLPVSCEKRVSTVNFDDNTVKMPVTVIAVADKATKGYVTGATFEDTPFDKLHGGDSTVNRTMVMSAYMVPQGGNNTDPNSGSWENASQEGNYFVGETFQKGDGCWKHDPAIYWPLASKLDFLAISSGKAFASGDVRWDSDNASSAVVLNVDRTFTQDDILFSAACGKLSSGGSDAVAMKFGHAQAWLSFELGANADSLISVKEIIVENVYTSGELNISRKSTDDEGIYASAKWNFRRETRKDEVFDDSFSAYGGAGTEDEGYKVTNGIPAVVSQGDTPAYLDMLIPEQGKTSFVIEYYLSGQPKLLRYRFILANENWLMGEHYIYKVNFSVNEISVEPSVKEFTTGNVSDLSGGLI